MSIERVIDIELGGEIGGAIVGGIVGYAMSGPCWVLLLCAPALTLIIPSMAMDLFERRVATSSLTLIAAMIAVLW